MENNFLQIFVPDAELLNEKFSGAGGGEGYCLGWYIHNRPSVRGPYVKPGTYYSEFGTSNPDSV